LSLSNRNAENNDSRERSFFNHQKEYFGHRHIDAKVLENDELIDEEFIPSELPKKKIDKSNNYVPITPRITSRALLKMNEINQKTIKCNLKLQYKPQLFTKRIQDENNDKESEASTKIGLKLKRKDVNPIKIIVNEQEIINNVKDKVFQSKNNQALFNVCKLTHVDVKENNKNIFSDLVGFCKNILK
jgi:hypothetical protein